MLEPLKQFYCDTCGGIINCPKEGWIEWISNFDEKYKLHRCNSFKIVHHHSFSPIATESNQGCYQHSFKLGRSDNHLHHFIDENYIMANILRFIDLGPYHDPVYSGPQISDMREFVEFVRRITLPYYEEARRYWKEAVEDGLLEGLNEISLYSTANLKNIVEKFG